MKPEQLTYPDPKVAEAANELAGLIAERYPDASFSLEPGEDDQNAVHLMATVDVADTDEVLDLVIDRLISLQVDEGLPLFVIPLQPAERVVTQLWQQPKQHRHTARVHPATRGV